jgi:serine protease AprX
MTGGAAVTSGRFDDAHGHGTFMASLVAGGPVAATKNRSVGVAPAATVVVVKVADASGSTSLSAVVAGLDWVAQHAATVDVANLSFSHSRPSDGYGGDPLNAAVERVVQAGVVAVVSAGNDADVVGDPGFDPKALTVGAADLKSNKASVAPFSGSAVAAGVAKPDLVANGVSVLGVLPPDSTVARANPAAHAEGDLWRGTGTSQATAITCGAAALFLQAHPSATPAQVKASLRTAARDLPGSRDGQGLLNPTEKLVSAPDGAALDGSGDLTGEASFDASSWSASSWSASSWSASSWSASSWSASSWSAAAWPAS